MTIFGNKLSSEERAERNQQCRHVVSEIMNFGVSQEQIWYIVYLLSLELEDIDDMKALSSFIKTRKGKQLFLSATESEE